jgi:hypothetical protein
VRASSSSKPRFSERERDDLLKVKGQRANVKGCCGSVAAGISDHVWSMEEIVGLLDAAEKKAA